MAFVVYWIGTIFWTWRNSLFPFYYLCSYCNERVIKYNAEGKYVGHFGMEDLDIPHSLALVESQDLICVADREHMR